MAIVIFTMLVILVVAVGVIAVVVMGIEGTGSEQHPELADMFAKTAQHLSGEAEPPAGLKNLAREFDEVSVPSIREIPASVRSLRSAASAASAESAVSAQSATSAPSASTPEFIEPGSGFWTAPVDHEYLSEVMDDGAEDSAFRPDQTEELTRTQLLSPDEAVLGPDEDAGPQEMPDLDKLVAELWAELRLDEDEDEDFPAEEGASEGEGRENS